MAGGAIRVLLVDDDEDEFVLLGDLLRASSKDHYELTWAPTYEQGLAAILGRHCDVCLIDYRLGARSGLDLLAEVKMDAGYPQVLLMTGQGDRDVDLAAAKAGAADYLVKGELTGALLERSIRYAVERGRTLQELREARERAQAMNLAKSAFVATMSHEIRTPMNAILGMADMLWESNLNADQRQYVEVFRRAGSGLLLLINDILDLSKIEAGHLELERVEFDLEEVVDQAIELTAVKARTKSIGLFSHLAPGLTTWLMGDPTRLRQVLINLLGNAVKFTKSGEIVLEVKHRDIGPSYGIEIAVSDTGIGIPGDKLDTIFDDFTQADASTTRKYGGTGLGLGISRRLVQAMGGSLTATSAPGEGSTFRFTAQFELAPVKTRAGRKDTADIHGKRVLLIDDNATNCLILQETLQSWGVGSDTFREPVEALARLPGTMAGPQPYSLVVIDSCMPGMNGFEGAVAIRRIAPDIPIVMLTSDARPGDLARRGESGISGYAVKPVTRAHLLRLVCDAMEKGESAETRPWETAVCENTDLKIEPANLLVAEDSADNRLLIRVYLKDTPYQLTFEEDGEATVDRFAHSDFDLILMDVQMPVMDGLAATRAIRGMESARGSGRIPIVALTANAGAEDIQRSGEAGCDSHLSKPISKTDLIGSIEKYRRRRVSPVLPQRTNFEPIGIEIIAGLEDIVPGYLASRRKEAPEMLALLAASDYDRLKTLGHNLKGTGGAYGFPELSRLGAALETSAKETDGETLRTQMTELVDYLDRVQLIPAE